jgi:hypothetical protein
MQVATFLISFTLFFILTPGVITRLPSKQTIIRYAVIHALLFAFLMVLVHGPLLNALHQREGMSTSGSDGSIRVNLHLRDEQIASIKSHSGTDMSIKLGPLQTLLTYAFYLYQTDKRRITEIVFTPDQIQTILESNSLTDFNKLDLNKPITIKPTNIVLTEKQWSDIKTSYIQYNPNEFTNCTTKP